MKAGAYNDFAGAFGARVRLLRFELKKTQDQFGELLRLPEHSITELERGEKKTLPIGGLGGLIQVVLNNGFSLHWLLAGIGLPKTDGTPNGKIIVLPEGGEAVVTIVSEARIARLLEAPQGSPEHRTCHVRLALKCSGVSQVQIADELNITRQAVNLYLTGTERSRRMQLRIWEAFCRVSGKDPSIEEFWGALLAPGKPEREPSRGGNPPAAVQGEQHDQHQPSDDQVQDEVPGAAVSHAHHSTGRDAA